MSKRSKEKQSKQIGIAPGSARLLWKLPYFPNNSLGSFFVLDHVNIYPPPSIHTTLSVQLTARFFLTNCVAIRIILLAILVIGNWLVHIIWCRIAFIINIEAQINVSFTMSRTPWKNSAWRIWPKDSASQERVSLWPRDFGQGAISPICQVSSSFLR